ncbi:MAG: nitroreductase family deazaflavin-dependent oxidoreductase [Thermomicrobiales bacterium]
MSDFNTQIIEEFRSNDGKVGGMFEHATLLLLRHTGRKSGKPFVAPLVYFADGERLVIVASKGGAPENPEWYNNLMTSKETSIEIGTETKTVRAIELTGDERDTMWALIVSKSPGFGEYQQNTKRLIPLIGLHPVS